MNGNGRAVRVLFATTRRRPWVSARDGGLAGMPVVKLPSVLPLADPGAYIHTPDDTSNGVLTVGVYHLQHPCAVPDCEREAKAADYCAAHLVRIARHGEPGPATFGAYIRGGLCSVPGCEWRRYALALCSAHYMAARRRDAR